LSKFYAHKNFEILIKLFREYKDMLKGVRCITTISIDQHPNAPKFLNEIKKYDLQDRIVNIGPITQKEISNYYNNSDAFFLPTLMETFGMCYLEAMHFGLPILTSSLDFAKWICRDSAIFFNPWHASDIAQKIMLLKSNPGLKQELIEKGKNQLNRFPLSWEKITKDVIRILENLVN
jgi:glycosyltransferase involved in cell wall biosynthesis